MVHLVETCSRKVSEQRHVAEQQHREIVERISAQHEAEMQVGRTTIQQLTKEVNELKSGYAAALEAERGKVIHFETLAGFYAKSSNEQHEAQIAEAAERLRLMDEKVRDLQGKLEKALAELSVRQGLVALGQSDLESLTAEVNDLRQFKVEFSAWAQSRAERDAAKIQAANGAAANLRAELDHVLAREADGAAAAMASKIDSWQLVNRDSCPRKRSNS
jgi:vacuolar-type H+-ATPase subunit I/STV1